MSGILLRVFAAVLFSASIMSNAYSADWYVKASAKSGGDGSKSKPFNSLEDAESASGEDDTIYIRQSNKHAILDGQIVLKPGQKLIGLGPDVREVPENAAGARMTYSGGGRLGNPADAVVQLSSDNEISNIHFKDFSDFAIVGFEVDFSGANIHDNLFTGGDIVEEPPFFFVISLLLETSSGNSEVIIKDNVIRDGVMLGGIEVNHREDSSGTYHFEGNHFETIGFRAHGFATYDTASLKAEILNSSSINIGAQGERSEEANSDSIAMQLRNSSRMELVVDGYVFDNPGQFGGFSNTGLELIFWGPGAGPEEWWAVGAEASLKISNSSFSNSVTEAIQLLNLGLNSTMNVEIRNTKIVDANPQQVGPPEGNTGSAIAVVPEFYFSSGNQTTLLVENCDIIGSTGAGIGVYDVGAAGFTSTIDLGGGTRGSIGNNRFVNNAVSDVVLFQTEAVGRFNWWDELPPRVGLNLGSTFVSDPVLVADPRP